MATPPEVEAVQEAVGRLDLTANGNVRRGPYRTINNADKFVVTRYAVYNGNKKAIEDHPHLSVPPSSLSGWCSKYRTAKRKLGMLYVPFITIHIHLYSQYVSKSEKIRYKKINVFDDDQKQEGNQSTRWRLDW